MKLTKLMSLPEPNLECGGNWTSFEAFGLLFCIKKSKQGYLVSCDNVLLTTITRAFDMRSARDYFVKKAKRCFGNGAKSKIEQFINEVKSKWDR